MFNQGMCIKEVMILNPLKVQSFVIFIGDLVSTEHALAKDSQVPKCAVHMARNC